MMNVFVLVYQEDKSVEKHICSFLEENGYKAAGIKAVTDMKKKAEENFPVVIITDASGVSEAAGLQLPFVVVSSVTAEKVKVKALDSGADDYIVMPFMKEEFLARLRGVLRRREGAAFFGATYKVGRFEIDFLKRRVKCDGTGVSLTPIEYRIVELLCRQPGCVLTHEYILKQIWGPYVRGDNKILRVNITNIRKKLEPDPSKPVYIQTENGIGYRMSDNDAN